MLVQFTDKYYNQLKVGTVKSLPDSLAKDLITGGYATEVKINEKPLEVSEIETKETQDLTPKVAKTIETKEKRPIVGRKPLIKKK